MKRKILISIILSAVISTSSAQLKIGDECQRFIDKITALRSTAEIIPGSENPRSLDVDEFLAAFDRLTLHAPGMRPVFVDNHIMAEGYGLQQIFLLSDSVSLDSFNRDWEDGINDGLRELIANNQLSQKLQAEDSPEGYFQFVVWMELGQQFAVDSRNKFYPMPIVCSKERFDASIAKAAEMRLLWHWEELTEEQMDRIRQHDPTPVVRMEHDRCIVQITSVSPVYDIYTHTFSISRSFPHITEVTGRECLVGSKDILLY